MNKRLAILLVIFVMFSLPKNEIQAQDFNERPFDPKVIFVIDSNGDSLVTSKIFKKQTNEDQVVFLNNGSEEKLLVDEVSSFYFKGRYENIKVSPDNTSKLVNVVLRGTVDLAKSITPNRDIKYYVRHLDTWYPLDHTSTNLKDQLSAIIEDFATTIDDRKIHYDLASLGPIISKYNEQKDSSLRSSGKFSFNDINKFGVYATSGLNSISINNEALTSGIANTYGVGLMVSAQYNRIISLLFQMEYSQSDWDDENFDFKFRTLDFVPMLSTQLYNKSNYFKVSAAMGLNINIDLASSVYSPEFYDAFVGPDFFSDEPIGLRTVNVGYQFMLNTSFGKQFDVFMSYQKIGNRKTDSYGPQFYDKVLTFDTTNLKFGFVYYFLNNL